jgi:hypothetical protein
MPQANLKTYSSEIASRFDGGADKLHSAEIFYLDGSAYEANNAVTSVIAGYQQQAANLLEAASLRVGSVLGQPTLTVNPPRRGDQMATEGEVRAAEIAAAEARTDNKITRLEGRLELIAQGINAKLDALTGQVAEHRRDRNLIIGTIVGTVVVATIALGGLYVAMATYADAMFGRGMNVRDVLQATVKETLEQTKKAEPARPQQ